MSDFVEPVQPPPSPASEDPREVFALLGDPATYGLLSPVTRIDTHAAAVFLAGPDAYKVKRAVKFAFMDLSTLEKRRLACEAEVAVNRRYAPRLYLGTVPVTREAGRLRLGGDRTPVEWTVHLVRFDEQQTLDRVAERGGLGTDLVRRLAEIVVATYAGAERRPGGAALEALAGVVEETAAALVAAADVFQKAAAEDFSAALHAAFRTQRPLLAARGAAGWTRRCHGDLHLRNIVLIDDVPTLFDALEFDESLGTTDVLYDFAFLLMDLWERGLRGEANLLLNRYLWQSPDLAADLDGLAALPLFLALRAAVRAKVEALRYRHVEHRDDVKRDALRYLDAARSFLVPSPARLVALGGLSGTGKSTLATRLAAAIGRAPGAVHLRSDIERKRLTGVAETGRLPLEAYRQEVTDTVFAALREQAERALHAGQSVIVDAVHRRPEERAALADVARRAGVPFTGLWLDAPASLMTDRVTRRQGDASDANAAIVSAQLREPLGDIEWQRLNASRGVEELAVAATKLMDRDA